MGFEGMGLVVTLTAGAGCWGGVPEVEGGVVACPMARAVSETESDLVFSLICFCFSSSFVKIGTRSSGMGFFNCSGGSDQFDFTQGQEINDAEPTLNVWLNLTKSAVHLSRSALNTACFFWASLCFSPLTKSRKAGTTASPVDCTFKLSIGDSTRLIGTDNSRGGCRPVGG